MTRDQILEKIPAKSITELIGQLAETRQRVRDGEEDVRVPLTTFHLRTGYTLQGWVWALERGGPNQTPNLLVRLSSRGQGKGDDLTYLDPGTVIALTVHNASEAAPSISFGAVDAPPPGIDPPTKLQLRRRCEELSQMLAEVVGQDLGFQIVWDGVPDEPDAMYALGKVVEFADGAVRGIAGSDVGKDELGRQVHTIRVEGGAREVHVRAGVLTVSLDFGQGQKGRYDRESLRVAIEKAL